ncbi:EC1118_1P2_1970p [Saccharomyces cerevisiae EC1118]|uniref:Putative uncharacterized protein YPL102C n=2 Tax=Saccharomyces cerevisiae TaxID=4932 RepID=YP102_YEAST|nr:RecName: Full=Putative uncharacterized protein YPL102C [Saccharomyces cerevisiae S288C]AAB68214.1 Ypl102cp [Saccharomyces cerevisiae]AAT93383.1 YPL102C [Saccharomyces cerevisiae]CAY86859.1 EC1118_1P2_1970p [Saccharomyces cerevisiae EC1118]
MALRKFVEDLLTVDLLARYLYRSVFHLFYEMTWYMRYLGAEFVIQCCSLHLISKLSSLIDIFICRFCYFNSLEFIPCALPGLASKAINNIATIASERSRP